MQRKLGPCPAILVCFFLLLPLQAVWAQTKDAAGTLSGTITDPSGARISGAQIAVSGTANRNVTADGLGHFSLRLPAGGYALHLTAKGFLSLDRAAVTVHSATRTELPLTMAVNAEETEINVNASSGDSTGEADNLTAIVLSGRKLETLSDDQSTFEQQVQAMAIGGDSGATQLIVDGFSGGRFPPKTSIREIRINSNPFSAEYDSIGFGRIEVFTKPGSTKLHGSIDVGGTDQSFNARNPYDQGVQPPYRDLFYQGNLNGPMGNKTSFFLAEERSDQQNNAVVNAVTLDGNNNTALTSTAVPNPQTDNTFSLRMDHQVTATNVVTGRYEVNTSGQINSGVGLLVLPSQGLTTGSTTQTLQLSDTQTVGAKTVVETRFEYVRTRARQTPNSIAPALIVEGSFSGGGSPAQGSSDHADHYELQEYVSHVSGPHLLRFGGRFRVNRDANTSTGDYNGVFTFPSLSAYQITAQALAANPAASFASIEAAGGGASQFNLTTGDTSAEVSTADLSAYAEDEWKLRKGLTLDTGMRFETQTAVPDHFDPAPRVGLAYALTPGTHKDPVAVFRSGFGMFYSRFGVGNLLTSVRQNGVSQLAYFVTDPQFYFTGDPATDPALLPSGSLSATQPTVWRVSPNYASPYTLTGSFSAEHGFTNDHGVVSVTWIGSRGVHQPLSRNLNSPLPGSFNSLDPTSGERPLGGTGNLYQYSTDGIRYGQTLSAAADLNPTKSLSVWAFYTLQFRSGDTGGTNSFPSNQYDLAADDGRLATSRQRLFSGLWYNAPKSALGLMGGLFFRANSGTPFNITTGTDLNGDTIFNDRPAFATDLTRPSVVRSRYGNFDASPIPGQTTIPINYATSPSFYSLQTSLAREFHFGPRPAGEAHASGGEGRPDPRYQLRFSVEAQNTLNHNNPGIPVGILSSPFFGQSISLAPSSGISAANRTVTVRSNFSF